jgi:hypothetical protein
MKNKKNKVSVSHIDAPLDQGLSQEQVEERIRAD